MKDSVAVRYLSIFLNEGEELATKELPGGTVQEE
jgi:hypothetical protein